jgi:hypothetical protein
MEGGKNRTLQIRGCLQSRASVVIQSRSCSLLRSPCLYRLRTWPRTWPRAAIPRICLLSSSSLVKQPFSEWKTDVLRVLEGSADMSPPSAKFSLTPITPNTAFQLPLLMASTLPDCELCNQVLCLIQFSISSI